MKKLDNNTLPNDVEVLKSMLLEQQAETARWKHDFIPAKVQVIRHVRPKYSCRTCEQQDTETKIKQAPMPPSMLPKSIATPSLLGQIITAKFQYGLPLYAKKHHVHAVRCGHQPPDHEPLVGGGESKA